jgi:hypothetical protein
MPSAVKKMLPHTHSLHSIVFCASQYINMAGRAVCKIETDGDTTGTGFHVLLKQKGKWRSVIVTAAHVVGRTEVAWATFSGGERVRLDADACFVANGEYDILLIGLVRDRLRASGATETAAMRVVEHRDRASSHNFARQPQRRLPLVGRGTGRKRAEAKGPIHHQSPSGPHVACQPVSSSPLRRGVLGEHNIGDTHKRRG